MIKCSVIEMLNSIKGEPKASDIDDMYTHLLDHVQDLAWVVNLKDSIVKVGYIYIYHHDVLISIKL